MGMKNYLLKRGVSTIFVIFAVTSLLFILFRLVPGDPKALVISPALDEIAQKRLTELYGLDKPIFIQYLLYIKNFFTFQWGRSFFTQEKVSTILWYKFWNTFSLMIGAILLSLFLGAIGGIVAAWKRGKTFDSGVLIGVTFFQSTPIFFTGMLFLLLLAYKLGLFPVGLMHEPGFHSETLLGMFLNADFLHHLILPLLSATLYYLSLPLLIMRSSMITALGSDYLLVALAKGLSNTRIIFKHAARNALLPVITIVSLLIGYAMGGQVILETVYSWPGMGLTMVEAVQHHDYPVAQATFGLMAILVIVLNFITDVVYCFLDPRIRY